MTEQSSQRDSSAVTDGKLRDLGWIPCVLCYISMAIAFLRVVLRREGRHEND
jgi:hypothetical protein